MPPGRISRFGVIGPTIVRAERIVPSPPQTTKRSGAMSASSFNWFSQFPGSDAIRSAPLMPPSRRTAVSFARASAGTEPDFGLNSTIDFMGVQTFRPATTNAAASYWFSAGHAR